jgi:spore germination cell wall hydrolase CwlJ-like protein
LTTKTQARAPARALVGAAAFGSLVGLAMGCAYLGGAMARAVAVKDQAVRLAPAAESNFSDKSLIAAAGADASALSIARRHDPYTVAGAAERDRQAAQFAARLEAAAPRTALDSQSVHAALRKAGFAPTPAARPFALPNALDASRDLDCLTQAVYYEARGEGVSGMQAVAQVVLNRVRHPAFPKTVCGVVYQGAAARGCQFSFACDGRAPRNGETVAWRRARDVAAKALAGHVMAEVGNATHFHALAVNPGWGAGLMRVAQVGSHVFYRFGGRAGAPNAFTRSPSPSTEELHPVYAGFAPATPDGAKAAYAALLKTLPGVGQAAGQPAAAAPAAATTSAAAAPAQTTAAATAAPAPAPAQAATVTAAQLPAKLAAAPVEAAVRATDPRRP